MPTPPKAAFEAEGLLLPLEKILPVRAFRDSEKNLGRYGTILASIREVGVIEPLIVYPQKGASGSYVLLDGHLRFHALKDLKITQALCLVSTDDESYSYNHWVSRLAPIQEHAMIIRAIKNGVSPEKIAAALKRDVGAIRSNMNLLAGIHAEVIEMLKDKHLSPTVFQILRKVNSVRQIEMAELMTSANNFTRGYAQALFVGTLREHLVDPSEPKKAKGMSPEDLARMEEEMESLKRDFKAVEASYGQNVLQLTLAGGYLRKLLENSKVTRFLSSRHAEVLSEFQRIVAAGSV